MNEAKRYKQVMIFGCFDGLHNGHYSFIEQAQALAEHVIAVLTPDELFASLKNHVACKNFAERKAALIAAKPEITVIGGDATLSSYGVIRQYRPDCILCGYDQEALQNDLQRFLAANALDIPVLTAQPFEPERYHSSLLRNKQSNQFN